MSIAKEFKEFAIKGNAIDMAVGLIVGAAFGKIVNSMVDDIFNPVLGLLVGTTDMSSYFIALKSTTAVTLEEAKLAGIPTINIGLFFNHVLTFLITAVAIFIMVKGLNRLRR